jgi:HEAT repeat protein
MSVSEAPKKRLRLEQVSNASGIPAPTMAAPEALKALVDQMPAPDEHGMYTKGIDKQAIEKAIEALHAGGRQSVVGLVSMLGTPGSNEDVKPHYALHCLANYVLVIKDENARKELSQTLARELEGDRPKHVKAYLCQELGWVGREEAAPALGKLLLDEDLVEPAAMALAAIRAGAAEQFRAALPQAKGKCRLNVIQGLGAVEDAGSVEEARQALRDSDREVRLAAGWSLARVGDAGSADLLLQAADVEPGWERIQAAKHCLMLAEKLAAAGNQKAASKIYSHLRDTRTDPSERYIREAAEKAMRA